MRVAVVGGGVAGLACALALRDRGCDVIVLEREKIAGGKVATTKSGEWLIERGPAGVLDNAPSTQELYKRLELDGEVVVSDDAARHRYLLRGGRLRELPDSPPKLLLSRALTLGEKWRLVREPAAPPPPEGVDETVAEFARRRLGRSIAETFAEPMVSGVFAGDYARLSLASAFPRVAEMERAHQSVLKALIAAERARKAEGRPRTPVRLTSLRGGMGALPAALARELGESLRTGADVSAIDRHPGGFTLETRGGPVEAERVVLALPPDDAARLVAPIDDAAADAWRAIPVAPIAVVTLGFARDAVAHHLNGFGFLVPRLEGVRLLGSIWMTSTFPRLAQAPAGHVVLRCMLGGAQDPAAVALSDEELHAIARDGLLAAIGLHAQPAFAHVTRWTRGIAQYHVGHAARVATIESRGAPMGLFSTGAGLRGVGVNDVIREAAALAARIAA